MSNKFAQSVLHQLEQSQKTQPKPKMQTKIVTKSKEQEVVSKAQNIENSESKQASDFPDMTEFLRVEPQRTAKNKTFYLDVEVVDALSTAARRQNVTDSKLCNDILRRVLGIQPR